MELAVRSTAWSAGCDGPGVADLWGRGVPYLGVSWDRGVMVKPKDHQRGRVGGVPPKTAVAWRKKQEKERVKAAKPTSSKK